MINNERMILNFIEMAKISSPSFKEREMADYVINAFNALGYEVFEDDAAKKINGNTGNLIINIPGNVAKTVLLSAHLDTVAPCDHINVIRNNGKIETDKTSVLGGDDKIGIAMILEIVQILKEVEKKPSLRIVISVCEEKGLKGAASLDPEYLKDVDFGYVLDGGDDVGTVTHQAPYRYAGELIVVGKEAHAGLNPEKGINALLIAAHALTKLKLGRIDEETTSNIGVVSGGLAQNIVMKEVRMLYETRSISLQKIEQQVQIVRETFKKVCGENGAKFEDTLQLVTTGYSFDEKTTAIQLVKKACKQLNLPFEMKASGGASDANIFNQFGTNCLVLSVGMKELHTVNEYVLEKDFVDAANMLLATIQLIGNEMH